jgi:putative hydrolase of the HAD superfamily
MRIPRGVEAVLLDVGGVLLLPDHRTMVRAFATAGAEVDPARLDPAHYVALAAIEAEGTGPAGFAAGEYWVAYARAVGLPKGLVGRVGRAVELLIEHGATPWTRPVPGCAVGLQSLADTGVRIVLVTNSEHGRVEATLRRRRICQVGSGPAVSVDGVVDSHVVGVAKPDAAIFQLALECAGVDAAKAVHVGDSVRADVEGARGAGIAAVHLDPLSLCTNRGHPHARSLEEVAVVIKRARVRA